MNNIHKNKLNGTIEYAYRHDLLELEHLDKYISKVELVKSIDADRVILYWLNDKIIGWLRYNLFWDKIPFMNMLYVLEDYQGQGVGKELVVFWENELKQRDHQMVMTSSLANETAQHFYRKLGYQDSGSLMLEDEALEIIFTKKI
jgi:ribosomal protein S18 acetylase RimI-like enzyme